LVAEPGPNGFYEQLPRATLIVEAVGALRSARDRCKGQLATVPSSSGSLDSSSVRREPAGTKGARPLEAPPTLSDRWSACNAHPRRSSPDGAGGVSGRPAEQPRGVILERLLPLQTVEGTSASWKAAGFAARRRKGDLRPVGRAHGELQLPSGRPAGDPGARNEPRRGTTSAIAMRWQPGTRLCDARRGDSSFARCFGPHAPRSALRSGSPSPPSTPSSPRKRRKTEVGVGLGVT